MPNRTSHRSQCLNCKVQSGDTTCHASWRLLGLQYLRKGCIIRKLPTMGSHDRIGPKEPYGWVVINNLSALVTRSRRVMHMKGGDDENILEEASTMRVLSADDNGTTIKRPSSTWRHPSSPRAQDKLQLEHRAWNSHLYYWSCQNTFC
jgi:hypothetical protein